MGLKAWGKSYSPDNREKVYNVAETKGFFNANNSRNTNYLFRKSNKLIKLKNIGLKNS